MANEKKRGIFSWIGVQNDYDEDDEEYSENENEYDDEDDAAPVRRREAYSERRGSQRRTNVVSSMPQRGGVTVYSIKKYNEVNSLVNMLLQNRQVLLKFDQIEAKRDSQRVLDFMSGASYAIGFQVIKIEKDKIYMFISNKTQVDQPKRVEATYDSESVTINDDEY